MHKKTKQVKTCRVPPRSPSTPLLQHIFTALSIYFSPPAFSFGLRRSIRAGPTCREAIHPVFSSSCSPPRVSVCPQHFSTVYSLFFLLFFQPQVSETGARVEERIRKFIKCFRNLNLAGKNTPFALFLDWVLTSFWNVSPQP